MRLLNKIYGLVRAGRCLFNIFFDDNCKQSQADRRVFSRFDDGEVKMVVFMQKFKLKSMVEKFGVEKASKTPASSGVPTLSPSGSAASSEEGGRYVEEAVGVLM